jgi:hypothetical protein
MVDIGGLSVGSSQLRAMKSLIFIGLKLPFWIKREARYGVFFGDLAGILAVSHSDCRKVNAAEPHLLIHLHLVVSAGASAARWVSVSS